MQSVAVDPRSASAAAEEGSEAVGDPLKRAIVVDTEKVRGHLDEVVRSTVEDTLNNLLNEEADRIAGAGRYERSAQRQDTRAGSYNRKLQTKAGEVTLTVPRLRKLPLETAIIERYKRRESSVEEALIEMYLAGVSMRRVEDITEALWGTRVSASAVSGMAQKVYAQIETWRNRPIKGEYSYVYLDGLWLKRSWGGEVKNIAVLVAIGVDAEGYREVLGVAEGTKEDSQSWRTFLRHLKERGLQGVRLIISDKCLGLVEAVGEGFVGAAREAGHRARVLIRDRDGKFGPPFDAALRERKVEPVVLPHRSPNMNAYAERFIQTLQVECLNKFIAFGTAHLDHLNAEFSIHYNRERSHSAIGRTPAGPPPPDPLGLHSPHTTFRLKHSITTRTRLGGTLRTYERKAA